VVGSCEHSNESLDFVKGRGLLDNLQQVLASQEELYFMYFIHIPILDYQSTAAKCNIFPCCCLYLSLSTCGQSSILQMALVLCGEAK